MEPDFGFIKSVEIGNDKEDDSKHYIADATFEDDTDNRKIQIINLTGVNVRPKKGHKILVIDLGGAFELGICTDDGIDADLEDGEIEIYSIDSDNKKSAKIKLKPDGTFCFNDGNDNLVRYSKLKEEFDKLKKDFNDFISNQYNYHTHVVNTTSSCTAGGASAIGSALQTSLTGSPSNADISSSKIDEMNVP